MEWWGSWDWPRGAMGPRALTNAACSAGKFTHYIRRNMSRFCLRYKHVNEDVTFSQELSHKMDSRTHLAIWRTATTVVMDKWREPSYQLVSQGVDSTLTVTGTVKITLPLPHPPQSSLGAPLLPHLHLSQPTPEPGALPTLGLRHPQGPLSSWQRSLLECGQKPLGVQ